MRISKHRPSDLSIKQALLSGKTTLQVIRELKTNSQWVRKATIRMNLKCERKYLGDVKGCKSVWKEAEVVHTGKKKANSIKDSFVLNYF